MLFEIFVLIASIYRLVLKRSGSDRTRLVPKDTLTRFGVLVTRHIWIENIDQIPTGLICGGAVPVSKWIFAVWSRID